MPRESACECSGSRRDEPFHKVSERHQQREIEHDTVDDIVSGLFDISG